MSDLIATGTSEFATGAIDSATVLVNNVSPTDARHVNGVASAAIQIETVLGSASSLKGSFPDLATRLDSFASGSGVIDLTNDAGFAGPLSVVNGGTGLQTLTATKVLIGTGTTDVVLGSGLIYQGPSAVGSGSSITHEGIVSEGGNTKTGIHFFTDYTLSSGTLSVSAGAHRIIIVATNTITINGTISASGAGAAGGPSGVTGSNGGNGFAQPGGGGGNGLSGDGFDGGAALLHGITKVAGGAGGTSGNGSGGSAQSGASSVLSDPFSIMGGAGGGSGGKDINCEAGGAGGGSVVLIAPTIILGGSSVINTAGGAGSNGAADNRGGGGGGGAGNVYIFCRTYTDSGCTFTLSGGAGGSPSGTGSAGGAGATGVKLIHLYA